MACVYLNCKVKSNSDQQLLSCWLCDAHAHWSCAGFNGRTFDTIIDRSKGLRWSCLNCRTLDVDFYRMFRDAKLVLSRLTSDFAKVTENFNKMDSLFSSFEYNEGSPKRKKTSHSVVNNCSIALPNASNLISLLSPVVGENSAPHSLPSIVESAPPVDNCVTESNSLTLFPQSDRISGAETPVPMDVPGIVPGNVVIGGSPGVSAQDSGHAVNLSLVVVPPRRTVFLSRLSAGTTIDDIGYYLRSKLADLGDDVVIFKFNFSQPRDISSFKIMVPGKYFDDIVSESFWPEGVLVREYIRRDRNRPDGSVRLPPLNSVSKN